MVHGDDLQGIAGMTSVITPLTRGIYGITARMKKTL